MHNDPFTLVVALDNQYKAQGELYLDDGESYKHEKGEVVWREFKAGKDKKGVIRITNEDLVKHSDGKGVVDGVTELGHYTPENNFAKSLDGVVVERLVLLGMEKKPKNVRLEDGKELEWTFKDGVPAKGKKEGAASELIIKYPGVKIPRDWTVLVEF
jgi:alpha 1,3-glucosidase